MANWIQTGGTATAGGGAPTPPGDVRPIGGQPFSVTVGLAPADINGLQDIQIDITYDPPDPIGVFIGVLPVVETPDGTRYPQGEWDYNGDGTAITPGRYGTVRLQLPQPSASQNWKIYLVSRAHSYTKDIDGTTPNRTVAVNPQGLGYPVLPATFDFGGGLEANPRLNVENLNGDMTRPMLKITPGITAPTSGEFRGVDLYLKRTADPTYIHHGYFPHSGGANGATVVGPHTYVPRPQAAETGWEVVVVPRGATLQQAPITIVPATPPNNKLTFNVSAPSATPATAMTGCAVSVVKYAQHEDGSYTWGVTVTGTNPSAYPDFFHSTLTIQKVDSSGNPAPDQEGTERDVMEFHGLGVSWNSDQQPPGANQWIIPPSQSVYRLFRFRLYAVTHGGVRTLQTNPWGTGLAYFERTPDPKGGTSSTGQEYAPFVTGVSAAVRFRSSRDGDAQYSIECAWTNPTDAKFKGAKPIIVWDPLTGNLSASAGTNVLNWVSGKYFERDMIGQTIFFGTGSGVVSDVPNNKQILLTAAQGQSGTLFWSWQPKDEVLGYSAEGQTSMQGPWLQIPEQGRVAVVYFISFDAAGRENSRQTATTPKVTGLSVEKAVGGSGREYTELITNIINNGVIDVNEGPGITEYVATGYFDQPLHDPRYGGVIIVRASTAPFIPLARIPRNNAAVQVGYKTDWQPTFGAVSVPMAFISYDVNDRQNTYVFGTTPEINVTSPAQALILDLRKALAASVGTALTTSSGSGPLRVQDLGITEALLATFAVSQQKLANVPIIDTARIIDAAVTTAKIQNLAVTNALIANVAADKILAGTISAAVLMTAPTLIITSGAITVNIDSSNLVMVTNSGTSRRAIHSFAFFRIENSANTFEFAQVMGFQFASARGSGAFGDIGGAVFGSSLSGAILQMRDSNGSLRLSITTDSNFVTFSASSGGSAVPSFAAGFISVLIDGALKKIPYYNA